MEGTRLEIVWRHLVGPHTQWAKASVVFLAFGGGRIANEGGGQRLTEALKMGGRIGIVAFFQRAVSIEGARVERFRPDDDAANIHAMLSDFSQPFAGEI